MVKIVDKINAATAEGRPFFSFEYFPPRTEEGVDNLFERMDRMVAYNPEFCDITWGAGGTTADRTLDIATKMQNMICVETMMHLTCTNMMPDMITSALNTVKENGITNILALRGDPPKGQEKWTNIEGGFECALDLVKYIRQEHGDYFGITVAGYPEAHPDFIVEDPSQQAKNYADSIKYLKAKCDAGGELIVTQLFYDVDIFMQFVADCKAAGITAPIVPGIMPINNYSGFKRMTGFCKTKVPQEVLDTLEPIKDNDEAVKAYGIHLGTQMCRRLLDSGIKGLHMYSLNLERSVVGILENLGMIDSGKVPRRLPWRPPANEKRLAEEVRPIFWSNRPKSYLSRTSDWDSFPNGRWGNSASPGYGTLNDYQFMRKKVSEAQVAKRREMWGAEVRSVDDVQAVFVRYAKGQINALPWSDLDKLAPETALLQDKLASINEMGYLSINSQPRVNGADSSDPQVGWGRAGGYVYQKPYVEFFCSPAKLQSLMKRMESFPSITYHAVNAKGETHSNLEPSDVNAVTWGVFPGKEVVQPTVVDPASFMVWKDEAFELWAADWGALYEEGSASKKVLTEVRDTFFLVNIVDNDFVRGDLFAVFGV